MRIAPASKTFRVLFMCSMLAVVTLHRASLAQVDDPRYDTPVPLQQTGPVQGTYTINVLTSPEGFDNFDLGTTNAEPHMSTSPLNPLWFFNAFNTNSAFRTLDGNTWTGSAPSFPNVAGDPVTAYDSLGNLYYETMKNPITGTWVIKSTDGGQSWTSAVTGATGNDKNWIACDQTSGPFANYVYTTMTNSGVGNFSRSTNFGASFQTTFSASPHSLPGMMVAVGPNVLGPIDTSGGCVYVVTHSGTNAAGVYTFFVSRDGGLTFVQKSQQQFSNYIGTEVGGRSTVQAMRCRPYPFIAADNSFGPYRGRLYLVYASNNPAGNGNKSDIFLRYSTDQGATWSAATVVNDDPNSQNNFQFHPAIWCDKETGRLYIKFYDTRRVPTSDSMDVYATYTDDGGQTFAPNQLLTTQKFKINFNNAAAPAYKGDYDAITSNRYTSMAVWTDFRNNNYLGMTAYFPDFAMLVSPTIDTVAASDSINAVLKVPAVKLYTHSVKFSATVSPSANFTFNFPQGDSLTSYPDSVRMTIRLNNVPNGLYTVTVTGRGPNGTPVHRRTITVRVLSAFVTVTQPNGGEQIYAGTTYPIIWDRYLVDSVRIDYSTDGGGTWLLITPGTPARPVDPQVHPKIKGHSDESTEETSLLATFNWLVPNTITSNALVRVSDKNNATVFDVSNAAFSIIPPPAPAWRPQSTLATLSLYTVSVIDTQFAWAAGDSGRVIRTVNGGNTWSSVANVTDDVYNIFANSSARAFVATYSTNNARILRTLNGGLSWQPVYQNTNPSAFINAITMFDDNNGYAVGDPVGGIWTLLRTTDGGASWQLRDTLVQSGTEAGWNNAMAWVGNQYGWFGTNNNRVYRTTNGGTTWAPATLPAANSYAVSFATQNNGMVFGAQAAFSTNSGSSWALTSAQPGTVYGSVGLPLTPQRWYAVGGSQVLKTTNQGTNFTTDYTAAAPLNDVDAKLVSIGTLNYVTGYAVGNGTISKYMELLTSLNVTQRREGIPDEFALEQNYPNPFNPTTSIHYNVPTQASVSLKIFNMLGQEVAILVNGDQSGGYYTATWDGKNSAGNQVSSGVYFYRLEGTTATGQAFSAMKKMLMLK
jgi:photosystem II stability/assembly factor-like uncharacterized protein